MSTSIPPVIPLTRRAGNSLTAQSWSRNWSVSGQKAVPVAMVISPASSLALPLPSRMPNASPRSRATGPTSALWGLTASPWPAPRLKPPLTATSVIRKIPRTGFSPGITRYYAPAKQPGNATLIVHSPSPLRCKKPPNSSRRLFALSSSYQSPFCVFLRSCLVIFPLQLLK